MRTRVLSFLLTIIVTSNCVFASDKPGPEDYAVYVAAIKYIMAKDSVPDSIGCVVIDHTVKIGSNSQQTKNWLIDIVDSGFTLSHDWRRTFHLPSRFRGTHQDSLISELYGEATADQLVNSLSKLSENSDSLEDKFVDLHNVRLLSRVVDSSLRQASDKNGYWGAFRKKFGRCLGRIELSRVGFNIDTSLAFVKIDYLGGMLMGSDTFYLLSKDRGTWMVVKEECVGVY